MSIISQETFEKFTEEEKEAVLTAYQLDKTSVCDRYFEGSVNTFEQLFNKENLQPKPKTPKTWEDVEKEYGDEVYSSWGKLGADITASRPSEKIINKCIAALKIAKLIELGYGGMVTNEEWKDADIVKHCVTRDDTGLRHCCFTTDYEFLAFHTSQQFEEFMSHESNRKLVEQYYMV